MNILYLTDTEQSLFSALPKELLEGWEVEPEVLTFTDTPEHRKTRLQYTNIQDPKLKGLVDQAKDLKTNEEVSHLIVQTDLHGVDHSDIVELFFALGPNPISKVIEASSKVAKVDSDIEDIIAIAFVRHSLLESLQIK